MENYSWLYSITPEYLHIDQLNPHVENKALQQYLSYYQFDVASFDSYRAGFVALDSGSIFVQYFENKRSVKTILFVHGYLDHTGGSSRTINFLLKEGFSVVTLDLPGHGFSHGEAGYIASFDEYITAVKSAYEVAHRFVPDREISAMGHSTGAAVLFHTACDKNFRFKQLILVAPLYLPYRWRNTRAVIKIAGKLFSHQKRRFKRNSADKMYNKFIKQDPLQVKWLRADWMNALELWQVHVNDCPVYTGETYILQGTKDTTVEWKENLKFFEKKCSNIQIVMFPKARHQLLNESSNVRREAERLIKRHLEK